VLGFGRGESKDALLGAGIALAIGTALYGLGRLLERLLAKQPERRGRDWH
jgi:hypothetical protein